MKDLEQRLLASEYIITSDIEGAPFKKLIGLIPRFPEVFLSILKLGYYCEYLQCENCENWDEIRILLSSIIKDKALCTKCRNEIIKL